MLEKEQQDSLLYKQLIRKSIVAALVGISLFKSRMLGVLSGVVSCSERVFWFVIGVITFMIMLYSARDLYAGAWKSLKKSSTNMDTLIAIGTGAAWLFSMMVIIFSGWLPKESLHIYFEATV